MFRHRARYVKGNGIVDLGTLECNKKKHSAPQHDEVTMFNQNVRPKVVRVSQYVRFRFGRLEHVCKHWRSAPSR
ncbi:hypothetical protein NL30_30165 [Burkholderia contaminans]|nr:hypothetical protein NL30_30165 [Burkholderia contaminans]